MVTPPLKSFHPTMGSHDNLKDMVLILTNQEFPKNLKIKRDLPVS